MIDTGQAQALALLAKSAIETTLPHHVLHAMQHESDIAPPRIHHPAFHGSYDWHSCVHMHWSLARLLNQFPAAAGQTAPQVFDQNLTPENIATELSYVASQGRSSFERPYGWAWLLKLDAELRLCTHPRAPQWRAALAPLSDFFATSFEAHLPVLLAPVRHGVHSNTAFACILALQWARLSARWSLADLIVARAIAWFGDDVAHGVFWEPSGTDFLSPTLTEALLISHVLPAAQFSSWFDAFLPVPIAETPLEKCVVPGDRGDGQLVHWDGLNLSRAWCARGLVRALPLGCPQAQALDAIAQRGMAQSAPQVLQGEFVATHWLASFLLLAETESQGVM